MDLAARAACAKLRHMVAVHRKIARWTLRWRRLLFKLAIVALVVVVWQLVFSPRLIESLILKAFDSTTNGRLSLTIHRASPIFGIEASDIRVSNYEDEPLFTADELQLSIFSPSLLIGHIGVRELRLSNPQLTLVQRNGRWNFEEIFPSREPKEREKQEARETLNTLLPIKIYLNLIIEDFSLRIDSDGMSYATTDENELVIGEPWRLTLDRFHLRLAAITHTFNQLPLSSEAISRFRTLIVAINPFDPLLIDYQRADSTLLEGEATFTWFYYIDQGRQRREFTNRLDLRSNRLLYLSLQSGEHEPVDLSLFLDTVYHTAEERLDIHQLRLSHRGHNWLSGSGEISDLLNDERSLMLAIDESQIVLEPVAELLTSLGIGESDAFGGKLSLAPMHIEGQYDNIKYHQELRGEELYLRSAGHIAHSIPRLSLQLDGDFDLYGMLPLLNQPSDYRASERLAFGFIHQLQIPELSGVYNHTRIDGHANIDPASGIEAKLAITNLALAPLTVGYLEGALSGEIQVLAEESFDRIALRGDLRLPNGRYRIGESRSRETSITLRTAGLLELAPGRTSITIDAAEARANNSVGLEMLGIDTSGKMRFDEGSHFQLKLDQLRLNYPLLHSTLPPLLQHQIGGYRHYLSEGLTAAGHYTFTSDGDGHAIQLGSIELALPYLSLDDLQLAFHTTQSAARLQIHQLELNAFRNSLLLSLHGDMARDGRPHRNLHARLFMDRAELFRIHENIFTEGKIDIAMHFENNRVEGRIDIDDFSLELLTSECGGVRDRFLPNCRRFRIDQLNLDLPLSHEIDPIETLALLQQPERLTFNTYGFRRAPNLTLRSLYSSHDPRGEYQPQGYYYLGSNDDTLPSGLESRLEYRQNALFLDRLQMQIYKRIEAEQHSTKSSGAADSSEWQLSSTISGRDSFFNFAAFNPEAMEYGLLLQIKNLDLEPFLPHSGSQYDGVVSADLFARGGNLSDPLNHTTARLSIHRMSREFSGFATRIIMPQRIMAALVRSTLEIPGIDIELREGLIYADIQIRRGGIVGLFLRPSGDVIRQERIPIASFLERTFDEVGAIEQQPLEGDKNDN